MDSPLSNIDEVIADSEDEGFQPADRHKSSLNDDNLPRIHSPTTDRTSTLLSLKQPHTNDQDLHPLTTMATQIDYFAGFQEDRPAPSIAERAKMRQRKPITQPVIDVLELTDEDELTLKPQATKPKKRKAKEKAKKSLVTVPDTKPGASGPPQPAACDTAPLINAKLKIRPRPAKKTHLQPASPMHRTSQSTLPVPTSPFPSPQVLPLIPPTTSQLPPSSPLLTSPAVADKEIHLPPIEFLPQPPTTDSDAPLPPSLSGANLDEVYSPSKKKKILASDRPLDELADDYDGPIPPPTFFAGSSSSPVVNRLTTSVIEAPHTGIVDLTDLPPTIAGSSAAVTGSVNTITKLNKARKTKISDDTINGRKKKGKGKQVEVVIPAPAAVDQNRFSQAVPRRTGKRKGTENKLSEGDEDELNLGASHGNASAPTLDPSLSPAKSLLKSVSVGLPGADIPKLNKQKDKKRKSDLTEMDSTATKSPSKRKKSSETVGGRDGGCEEVPTKKRAPKRKEADQETLEQGHDHPAKIPRTLKGSGKMVILSAEDDVQLVFGKPLPEPRCLRKGTKPWKCGKVSEGDEGEPSDSKGRDEGELKGDRNVLKEVQPAIGSPAPNIPQQYKTPLVSKYPSITSKYTIAPKTQTPSMSDLIRRVNSLPNSPFPQGAGRGSPIPGLAYSPYLKSSRRALSRIAPLHPNRRTPPPPPPPPPVKKKSKKELEMEEKWEEEVIDEIGGITEWLALSENEKKEMKRMKRDREMGYCED